VNHVANKMCEEGGKKRNGKWFTCGTHGRAIFSLEETERTLFMINLKLGHRL
jgi:hypothetical protein